MMRIVCWLTTIFLITLAGCQSNTGPRGIHHHPAENPRILVLIPQKQFFSSAIGSKRYASAPYSRIPIHVRRQINELEKSTGIKEVDGWPIQAIGAYCIVFELSPEQEKEEILEQLSQEPKVLLAQPMHYFTTLSGKITSKTDPYATLQFGEGLSRLRQIHKYSMGENIRVGIIDSAVDYSHPDLLGQVKSSIDFVPAVSTTDKLHGTALAGIISATANNGVGGLGFAPAAELFVYGVCGRVSEGTTLCNTFDLARGIIKAMENNIDIINLSLAGPHDLLLELLLRETLRKDIIIVAADNSQSPEANFPASLPGVIAVREDAGDTKIRDTSSSRLITEPWYRRKERMSTKAGGGYQFFYGTSISTAAITGLAALIHSNYSRTMTKQWLEVATSGDCNLQPRKPDRKEFGEVLSSALGCIDDAEQIDQQISRRHATTHRIISRTGVN